MTLDYLSLAVLLFALGLVLFLAEYFLPTGGVLIVGGVLLCTAAVFVVARYGSQAEAIAAIVALCVGVPLFGTSAFYFWGRRMALPAVEDDPALMLPGAAEMEALAGRLGKTVSTMKPSGVVEIDGRRVDAVTEGPMIDAGLPIRCIAVKAGKVIVRLVDKPADFADVDFDSLK
jgi:membrane-bound serine protease (ClpP class)